MKFIEEIGQGGFGKVHYVVLDNGTECARKEFSPKSSLSADLLTNARKRFEKEVRAQSGIDHPNIVRIIDSDLSADSPSYLMPLADSSLDKDLEVDRTLDGGFVAALSDIVAALEELHSMRIYHRDLKPQNVLRFTHEEKPTYAISDLGFISMKETHLSELTTSGMRKGSDFYTAPEIATDLKKASAQSDIYSLGCILHDMVGLEDRVPLREIKEAGEFGPILSGCTKDDPNERFSSARAVLDAILAVRFSPADEVSEDSGNFLEMFATEQMPEPKAWARLADHLESKDPASNGAILGKMTADRIRALCKTNPDCAERIGLVFAKWVAQAPFDFDYCDAIADRVEVFYENCDLETKAECLMALLKMGTSHNRWYVERMFVRLCGPDMDDALAKRLIVVFHIAGKQSVCGPISHLKQSIGFDWADWHEKLAKTLKEFCA